MADGINPSSSNPSDKKKFREGDATISRMNAKLARSQLFLRQREESLKTIRPEPDSILSQDESDEKLFNAVADSATTGLGIGAKPREKDREVSAASKQDMLLRKKLLSRKADESKPNRSKEAELDDESPVESKSVKKRKQDSFLDELLAKKGGKKKR